MAQKFIFKQIVGNTGQVDRDEISASAAESMNSSGHKFLAHSGFSRQQHGGIGGCCQIRAPHEFAHDPALENDMLRTRHPARYNGGMEFPFDGKGVLRDQHFPPETLADAREKRFGEKGGSPCGQDAVMMENTVFLSAGQGNADDAAILVLSRRGGEGNQNRRSGQGDIHQRQGHGQIGGGRGGAVPCDAHRSGLRLVVHKQAA